MKKFWALNVVDSSDSELIIEGVISQESWWGDEATPQQLRDELKKVKSNNLVVSLNSVGGDVWAGLAMYNALRELDAKVIIRVDGLAASIASVIAMAGDEIIMSPGSMMMVHRASALAMGNAEDLEKAIEMLETVEESIIPIYSDRTGLSTDEIQDMLNVETWMSAEKAVELGFADKVAPFKKEEQPEATNVFSGNFAFSMSATKASLDSFVSKVAKAQADESEEDVEPETPEVDASEEPEVDTNKVQEDKKDTEEKVEPAVDNINPTEEQESQMTEEEKKAQADAEAKNKAIAQSQVMPPANQADVEPKAEVKSYLKSRESIEAYAKILEANAGGTATEVKDAWGEHLKATMGITNPEILLPTALITSIEDAFKEGGEIWGLVNKTGLTVYRATRDTVTGENSRAAGYNRADQATKREELITLADRVLRPQFIYKYITLNKEDIKENRDTGALVTYVLTELPRRIVREVERAIVIGDGRADDDDYKISSFLSLKDDAEDSSVWVNTYTPAVDESKYESLIRARATVKADGAKYLIAKTDYLTDLLLEQGVNGGYLFQPGTNLAGVFGFAGVISPDWLDEDTDNDAYIFVPSAYTTVGDNSIEAYTNFLLSTNKQEYLQEIYAGGAITKLDAGVAIAAETSSS